MDISQAACRSSDGFCLEDTVAIIIFKYHTNRIGSLFLLVMGIVKEFFSGIYNLGLGLWTTLKYIPKKSVTLQYPKEKMEMFEGSRGMVVLLSDKETGKLNCTACLLCQKACPVAAIQIKQEKNEETKKRFPSKFIVNTLICCYCGLCEESCNFAAIKLAPFYEFSTPDKDSLIFDMEKLQELGGDHLLALEQDGSKLPKDHSQHEPRGFHERGPTQNLAQCFAKVFVCDRIG